MSASTAETESVDPQSGTQPAKRFCFFTERQVGIGSAAQAIEPYVKEAGHVWRDVTYVKERGLIERLPIFERGKGTLRGFFQVSETLRQGPFDAILFLTHNPAVFHPRALRTSPTVLWTDVTPHQLDSQAEHYGHPVTGLAGIQLAKKAIVRDTFRQARFVVGWSNWARRSFTDDYGVPEERTRVVHPGIDLSRWQMPARPATSGLPRLLFVGGDFERKGGSLLLDVFRKHFRGRAELDLVTRDPVEPEEGVRVHRGLQAGTPPLLDLYRKASVFVLPTQGDCFSIASMEAMAMGLPVVVSDVGGISDIVEQDASGLLIPPRSGLALRESLERFVEHPEVSHTFGLRGRALVEEKFDAKKSAEALLGLLRQSAEAEDSCNPSN